ncbi:MAG: hypothetical protein GQ477_03400 [Nanohaloarchaea archaeon]|nr:hypothetical protein [Candidatus Nanohaloarchaea archaeon]
MAVPAFTVSNPYWFDTDWHFRTNLTINNSDYARDNWPIELDINFTDLLYQSGKNGTFDNESIRVIEHNSSGSVLFEHPFQFDDAIGFNNITNALGTITFLLNGTTTADQIRYVYVYFDIAENTVKTPVTYSTNLNYSWDGEEVHVNNSIYRLKIDTLRGENTSGLYDIYSDSIIFITASTSSKTKEYTQFSNGTDTFSFDFRNNATFSGGNIKRIVEQAGVETLWDNPGAVTGFGFMRKRYIFYENTSWIKIEQNYTNVGVSSVTRNSTSAGALSVNDLLTPEFWVPLLFWNMTNPMSWFGASDGSRGLGLINYNYSSNANVYAKNDTFLDRMGIHLDPVTIAPNESVTYTTIMQFNGINYNQVILKSLRDQMYYPPIITLDANQFIPASTTPQINYSIYNRNDSVLIIANVTSDVYNIVTSMNATVDMGTLSGSDDLDIVLYDDGDAAHGDATVSDGIFSNMFNLSENSIVGVWNVTVRAFDSFDVLLVSENTSFNVTDRYNVTLNISNPLGIVDRVVNATINVKNSRDESVGGATINCTYGAGPLTNITDFDNGTYLLNFTAPAITGNYILVCNGTKFNNTDGDSQSFNTETSETTMSLAAAPQNHTSSGINLLDGDTFMMSVNTTDIGGANAKAVNISLTLPVNFSANSTTGLILESCGDVLMSFSCIRDFNISVLNGTIPGNYTINISTTWINPNLLTNSTNVSFITYVLSNPIIDVSENNVSGIISDGKAGTLGNFTVESIGNDNITDVTFNVSGLSDFSITFNPLNISSLVMSTSQSVSVDVAVPQDYVSGIYSGTINVSSLDGGWKMLALNVTVPGLTTVSFLKSPDNYTSSIISLDSGDYFDVTTIMTNDGISDAKNVNITLSMPININSNSTFEQCGRVNSSDNCTKMFNITISNYTAPGNYTFNMTSSWVNPDLSVSSSYFNFTVQVVSNPIIDVSGGISSTLSDNSSVFAGNFTIDSLGNDNLTDITFTVSGLPDFTFKFSPDNLSDLGANMSQSVSLNVSVPFAQSPGNYTGEINVSSVNGGHGVIDINVTVDSRREWDVTPKSCLRSENPDTGTVCVVTIKNTGNVPLNITINSVDINYTSVNETNMTIPKNSDYAVEFLYNVTNVTKDFYYENYTINATEVDAVPQHYDFNITLIPYIVPLFLINLSEVVAKQDTNIEIFANITDRSTTGLNWTMLNVTLPNGTIDVFNMSLVATNGTTSLWFFNYSGNMSDFVNYTDGNASLNISNYTGSTVTRGTYNFSIYSQDNTGVIGVYSSNFKIYTNLVIGFTPGSTKYYQGSTGSIYYTVTDTNGVGISDANVTISLMGPDGYVMYTENFMTDPTGQVSPVPTFAISNDATVGIYNFTAEMTYYDTVLETDVTFVENSTFTLQSGSSGGGGGLTADIDTGVLWYPDNVMRFEMWFSYAGNVTEPDNMTLFVYDPAENLYFNVTLNDTNNTAPGLYHYKFAMPMSSASGYYYAILTASKEGFVSQKVKPFRVSKGGPYDVRVMIIPPYEVQRQDYVNFNIYIENMGEVTQDVYLDYWVSYGNDTYYYNSEAVLTPAGVNVTITRSAYIFSNQHLGINTLNVMATYDSVQAPIISNETFEVIEDDVEIPPPPDIPEIPPVVPSGWPELPDGSSSYEDLKPISDYDEEHSIFIETYNKEINIVKGWTDISGIRIRNNGWDTLTDITLELTGIPSSWFNITPEKYEAIPSGNSTLFLVEYSIPKNAESGVYPFTLVANSKEVSDDKMGRLIVFTSIEELIRQDIINLKIEINKLEGDLYFARNIGKDVSAIWTVIDQAWIQLVLAEENVDDKLYDDALQNIQVVSGLVKRAKMLLEAASDITVLGDDKSVWVTALKALVVMGAFAAISMWWIKKKDKFKLKKSLTKFKKKTLSKDEIEIRKKDLLYDKTKIQRVLKLLESESKDGIMNKSAYDELKKLNEKKIATIDKKIKKL